MLSRSELLFVFLFIKLFMALKNTLDFTSRETVTNIESALALDKD